MRPDSVMIAQMADAGIGITWGIFGGLVVALIVTFIVAKRSKL